MERKVLATERSTPTPAKAREIWDSTPAKVRERAVEKYQVLRAAGVIPQQTPDQEAIARVMLLDKTPRPSLVAKYTEEAARLTFRRLKEYDVESGKWEDWCKRLKGALDPSIEDAQAILLARRLMGYEACKRADLLEGHYDTLDDFLLAVGTWFQTHQDEITRLRKFDVYRQQESEKGHKWFKRYMRGFALFGDKSWPQPERMKDFLRKSQQKLITMLTRDKVKTLNGVLFCLKGNGEISDDEDFEGASKASALVTKASDNFCTNCNRSGHTAEKCWLCLLCKKKGHKADQCPLAQPSSRIEPRLSCLFCGEAHLMSACPSWLQREARMLMACAGPTSRQEEAREERPRRENPSRKKGGGGGKGCRNCASLDHSLRQCPTVICHKCKKEGHIATDCKKDEPRARFGRCGNCGRNHDTKDCRFDGDCNRCDKKGHIGRLCKTKPKASVYALRASADRDDKRDANEAQLDLADLEQGKRPRLHMGVEADS